jgi:hypothetical protein
MMAGTPPFTRTAQRLIPAGATVWRVCVVAGTAAFLTLLTLVSLGVGALLRRTAAAISVVAAAVFVPVVVTPFLPGTAATWLQRISPLAGMSIQQVRETDDVLLLPWAGRPWAGLAVLRHSATPPCRLARPPALPAATPPNPRPASP